ncbi:hypothetical protein JXO59_07265 [candidate division KSB1 bacterium]|nr:hypothetical protein [candidate division KSB1 bacterium]
MRFSVRLCLIILTVGLIFAYCDKNSVDSKPADQIPDDSNEIMSFDEISQLQRGQRLYLYVNREGLEIERQPVVFDGLYVLGRERLLLCHTENDFLIGAGDSGSPVKTADGRTVGALCYGYYGNSTRFEARVIEDMLGGHSVAQLPQGSFPPEGKRIFPLYFAHGIRRELLERLAQTEMSHYLPDLRYMQFDAPHQRLGRKPSHASLPRGGSTIAIFDVSGDVIHYGAYGSVSLMRNDTLFAFGHRYSIESTPVAGPTYLADMISFIESGATSSKAPMPTQELIGSFVYQDDYGIRIIQSTPPSTFPLLVTLSFNGNTPVTYRHEIASAHSVSLERYLTGAAAGALAWNYIRGLYYYETIKANITANIRTDVQEYQITGEAEDVAYWIDYAISSYVIYDMFEEENDEHFQNLKLTIDMIRP